MVRIGSLVICLIAWGCGSGPLRSPEELEKAKNALNRSLEAWKKNESEKQLANGRDPVRFSDDWRKAYSLTDYEIGLSTIPDERTISFAVMLKLKDRRGKEETTQTAYLVELANPIRVTRDPYN